MSCILGGINKIASGSSIVGGSSNYADVLIDRSSIKFNWGNCYCYMYKSRTLFGVSGELDYHSREALIDYGNECGVLEDIKTALAFFALKGLL